MLSELKIDWNWIPENQTEIDDSDDEIEEKQTPIYSYLEEDEYLFGDDDSENASH